MDFTTLITLIYAQAGFLLLGFLVYRRLRDLRAALLAVESSRHTLAVHVDKSLVALEHKLELCERQLARQRGKRAVKHLSGLRRQRALERLQTGAAPAEVCAEFGLRPVEAAFLARLAQATSVSSQARAAS